MEDICSVCSVCEVSSEGVYDSERLGWLGGLSHNVFEDDEAHDLHLEIAERNHKTREQYLENCKMSKPFKYELAAMNGSLHYKTLNSYDEWDIIMHCYGIIARKSRDEIFRREFTDEGPMVMVDVKQFGEKGDFGLMLDGRDEANNWKHVTESCHPNCAFVDNFMFKKQGDVLPSYRCLLRAITKIEVGETLRVKHKHERGFKLDDTTCDCEFSGMSIYDENATPICSELFCVDYGVKFENVRQLYLHHLNYHSDEDMIEKIEEEMAYIKSFRYSCPVHSCMKWFKNAEEWRDHLDVSHPKFEGILPTCSTCGKQFIAKRALRKHVKKGVCDEGN